MTAERLRGRRSLSDGVLLCRALFLLALLWDVLLSWYPLHVSHGWSAAGTRMAEGLLTAGGDDAAGHVLLAFIGIFHRMGFEHARLSRHVLTLVGCFAAIEFGQAFVDERHFRGGDLIVNSLSGGLGLVCGAWLLRAGWRSWLDRRALVVWRLGAVVALLVLAALFGLPRVATQLRDWDRSLPLRLLNEGGDDRPWLGILDGVAIYPDSTSAERATLLAMTGFRDSGAVERRRARGVLLQYTFDAPPLPVSSPDAPGIPSGDEFSIPASSAIVEPPPALYLDSRGAGSEGGSETPVAPPRWLPRGGLAAAAPTGVVTRDSLAAVVDAMTRQDRFSIELRGATLDLEQAGPARLITQSSHPYFRNFMVGQERDALVFRVRNPANGRNGLEHQGVWPEVFTDRRVRHLLVSYDRGWMTLYRDGARFGDAQRVPWAPRVFGAPLRWNEDEALFLIFLCFGVALGLGTRSTLRWVLALWGLAFGIASLGAVAFDQRFEPFVFLVGFLVAVAGAFVARYVRRRATGTD